MPSPSASPIDAPGGHGLRRRAAAVGALVADALTAALVLVLLVRQTRFALAVIAVTLLSLVALIVAVASSGIRRLAATIGAAVGVVALVAIIVGWGSRHLTDRWLALGAVLVATAAALTGRYARRHPVPDALPPEGADQDAPANGPAATAGVAESGSSRRGCVLFVNPHSGDGKADEFDLVDAARDLGIETVELQKGDDLEQLARDAVEAGAQVLGMAGGDGSQACVLGVAAAGGVPYVCIPAGTRNHLALDLGLDRTDPRAALAAFTDGELRHIDLATVNGRVFVNNVALGVYAAIVDQEGYRDAKLTTALEQLPEVIDAGGPWSDLQFDSPEHGAQTSAALLLVSNNPYDVDKGSIQRRRLDQGVLGVIAIAPDNVREVVALTLLAAAGRPDASRALWRWEAATFRVDSDQDEVVAGIDGERCALVPPLEFVITPRGAQVLVPPGARLGLDEQLAGRGTRHAGLFEVAFNLPGDR